MTGSVYIDVNEGQCGAGMCSTHDEWETVSFRFVAPEDPVKIRIVANALQPEQNVYVDNVMLREVGAEPTAQEEEETVADESVPTIQAANTAPLEGQESAAGLGIWLYIIIGAAVVIAALAVVLVVRSRKKLLRRIGTRGMRRNKHGKEDTRIAVCSNYGVRSVRRLRHRRRRRAEGALYAER